MKKIFSLLVGFIVIFSSFPVIAIATIKNRDDEIFMALPADENIATINSIAINKKTKYFEENISYPQVRGLKNLLTQARINSEIKNTVMRFKAEIEEQSIEYGKAAEKNNWKTRPYSIVTKYRVEYNKNNVLSIFIDLYAYTGGAHGNTEKVAFNYNLLTGQKLFLKNLFIPEYDYKKIINNQILNTINSSPKSTYFSDQFKGIEEKQQFYISETGITVYFPLYAIAPYSSGTPEFKLPYSLFKTKLNIGLFRNN